MRAITLRAYGPPDVLHEEDVPKPAPRASDLVVRVRAASVNPVDCKIRSGGQRNVIRYTFPWVLGLDVSGVVEAVGAGVTRFRVGDEVWSSPTHRRFGTYAEYVCIDEREAALKPKNLSHEEAASIPLVGLTAYQCVVEKGRLRAGQTVLVHAGSGGVGCAAIQVAKHLGARVVATASSEEKRRFAVEQGADEAYGYEEFAAHVRPDVVVDPVGGKLLTETLPTLAPLGTIVAVGYAGGWWEELSPALLVGRNVGIQGFYLGRLTERKPEIVKSAADELLRLWSEGAVRPVVGVSFPLDQAAAAHTLIEERRHVAKVVLVP